MQETAEKTSRPVRIISTPGQITANTQEAVGKELEKMDVDGSTETTVPVLDQKPPFAENVIRFGGEVLNSAETFGEELLQGKGVETESRSGLGRGPRHWVVERAKNLIRFKRKP